MLQRGSHKKMRFIFILLFSLVFSGLVLGTEYYSDTYNNMDVDAIINSDRLLNQYVNCILDKSPCTVDGRSLKCEYTICILFRYIMIIYIPYFLIKKKEKKDLSEKKKTKTAIDMINIYMICEIYLFMYIEINIIFDLFIYLDILPEAIATKCEKCSDKQKQMARKISNHLKQYKPDIWTEFIEKYDPDKEHIASYEQFLAQEEAWIKA